MQLVRNPVNGQVVPSPPTPCIDCGFPMLGRYHRATLPAEERRQYRRHQAGGRCTRCYHRHQGETVGHIGQWRRDDLVYEWEFLAAQGFTRRAAARRLRVSYAALCKAIERSRPVQGGGIGMSTLHLGAKVNAADTTELGLPGTWAVWSQAADGPGAYFLIPSNDEARAFGVKYAVIRAVQKATEVDPSLSLIRTDPPRPELANRKTSQDTTQKGSNR